MSLWEAPGTSQTWAWAKGGSGLVSQECAAEPPRWSGAKAEAIGCRDEAGIRIFCQARRKSVILLLLFFHLVGSGGNHFVFLFFSPRRFILSPQSALRRWELIGIVEPAEQEVH